jgi:hypothetical protein
MADPLEMKAIGFPTFGGLRLDEALDQVGANSSIYQHDVDWDGSLGNFRTRDGFQKLNASAATGEYKGLWPHSAIRLLAVKRVKSTEAKIVALDKEGTENRHGDLAGNRSPVDLRLYRCPGASYTFMRSFTTAAKVIRFDGTTFTEPKATIENVTETGEKEAPKTEKAMPLAGTWSPGRMPPTSSSSPIPPATTGGPERSGLLQLPRLVLQARRSRSLRRNRLPQIRGGGRGGNHRDLRLRGAALRLQGIQILGRLPAEHERTRPARLLLQGSHPRRRFPDQAGADRKTEGDLRPRLLGLPGWRLLLHHGRDLPDQRVEPVRRSPRH